MNPYVNIHTHYNNHIDDNEFVEIQNIDVDNIVNVDVSHFYSIGVHPWNLKSLNLKISETQKLGDLESQ